MRRRPIEILRQWWPALALSALAVLSVQVLYGSYERWRQVLATTVSAVDNVTESRRRLLRAYLIEQRRGAGDPTFGLQSSLAELTAAEDALDNWLRGRSGIADLRGAPQEDPALIALGEAYGRELDRFRGALASDAGGVTLRRAFSSAEQAASTLTDEVYARLPDALTAESRRMAIRLGAWAFALVLAGVGTSMALIRRRSAEAERAQTELRLARLRAVAPVAIVECDGDGRIISANVKWCTATGRRERDWEGRPWWEAIRPADRDAAREYWTATIRSTEHPPAEFRLAGPGDDEQAWVIIRIAPGQAVAGQRTWIATFTDVTERRRAEEQLHHAQRMEAVGRLAGGIAHDFNNLLTSIGGFADLARDAGTEAQREADLEEIGRGVERGRALTRQLLTFSRQDRMDPQPLDLREVVEGIQRMLRRLVRRDIEIRTELGPSSAIVKADRGQVEQVITNLVINASDAIQDEGVIRIAVRTASLEEGLPGARSIIQPGEYVLLSISDTGVGMSHEVQRRMFDPFFTTKERGKGTGLGLSTVFGIVSQTGGHLHVYSEVGHGSVFKIYFPATDADGRAAPAPPPRTAEPEAAHGGTALIIEDEDAVRRLTRRILERKGWSVIEANDGQGAIDLLEDYRGPIDVVITDVMMRRMGGVELVTRLREAGRTMPVLLVSGYSETEVSLQGAAFLEKPFTPAALLDKVEEVMRRAAAEGETRPE